jgi:adenosylhomocysteine nucleosidase
VAAQLGIVARIGPVVSVPAVVCRAEDKGLLGRATGASAVDMESAALARSAQERAVPFMVLRTVSDLAGEDLPLDFNAFLRPSGWLKGMLDLIRHPSSLLGLNRLRRQSNLAADRLTSVCSAFVERGFGLFPAP